MPKAVIFDMDRTLIDTVPLHARAWEDTFRHFGHEVPAKDILGQIGKGGDRLIAAFLEEPVAREQGEAMERFRADLFKRRYLPQARGFPSVRELFGRIRRQGSVIAVASSCKADELDGYLELAGVPDLVDAATTTDDVSRSKPAPDIFEAALERLGGTAPQDAVVVGDSPYDAEAASKAGIKAIGLLSGGFPEAGLREAGYTAICRDPEDLLRRFDTSPVAARLSPA